MKKDFFIVAALTSYSVYKGVHSIPISLIACIVTTLIWWGCSKIWHSDSNKVDVFKAALLIMGGILLFIVSSRYISNQALKSHLSREQRQHFQKSYRDHTKIDIKCFIQERLLKLKILTSDNDVSLRDLVSEARLIDDFLSDVWINNFNEADLRILKKLHESIIKTVLNELQKSKLDDTTIVKAVKYGSIAREMVLNKDQIRLFRPMAEGDMRSFAKNLNNMLSTKEGRASFKRAFVFKNGELLRQILDDPEFKTLAVDIFEHRMSNAAEGPLGPFFYLIFNSENTV